MSLIVIVYGRDYTTYSAYEEHVFTDDLNDSWA